MKIFRALLAVVALSCVIPAVQAAPLLLTNFQLHGYDASILQSLGFERGTVAYLEEMGALSSDEMDLRSRYESLGCHPYYVLLDGKIVESGFNCLSFYCLGYLQGPKICRNGAGLPTGGVAEITRRVGLIKAQETRVPFASYAADQRTQEMNDRVAALTPLHCSPYYLKEFDVVVGEGYTCTEVGTYPFFSGSISCLNDWRTGAGMQCDRDVVAGEPDLRQQAILLTAQRAAPVEKVRFSDVTAGKYGATAIASLADAGILRGYGDGTFRPDDGLPRAAFLSLLMRTLRPDAPLLVRGCFSDIRGLPEETAICEAHELGWVRGFGDGLFHPEEPMSKPAALKVLTLATGAASSLSLASADQLWYVPFVTRARELQILREPFDPVALLTRRDAAVWLYRARDLDLPQEEVPVLRVVSARSVASSVRHETVRIVGRFR